MDPKDIPQSNASIVEEPSGPKGPQANTPSVELPFYVIPVPGGTMVEKGFFHVPNELIIGSKNGKRIAINENGNADFIIWYNGSTTPAGAPYILVLGAAMVINAEALVVTGYITAQGLVNLQNSLTDPASPVPGSIYFNTTTNKIKVYNGVSWETVTSA